MKFTYKKSIPTGRFRSFENEYHTIKLKKKEVGTIAYLDLTRYGRIDTTGNDGKFEIRFQVKRKPEEITKQSPDPFKWITIKPKFDTADLAKQWLNENVTKIKTLDLYFNED